jgi:hypothetical protein
MVGIYKSQYFVFNCCLTSEALVFLMGQSMSHQNFYLFYHLGGYFVNMQTAPKCKISIIMDILAGAFRCRSTISNRLTQQIETWCQTPWLSSSTGAELYSLKKIQTTGDENRAKRRSGMGHW